MPPPTNSSLRDRSPARGRGHAPKETELGRAGARAVLIAFAAIAWTAVTAAIDLNFGRAAWRNSFGTSRDLTTLLILATFSAPALFVWGACAAAGWQLFRRQRSFEPQFDRTARPERPALSEGSLGAAAMNAWMAALAAVFVLAVAFEFGAVLPRWAILTIYLAAVAATGLATLVKAWRPALSPSERWQRLAKKTCWTPLFTRPVVAQERHLLLIRERWGLRLLLAPAFLGAGMFGFLAFWRDPFGTLDHTPGAVLVFLQFILAGLVLVAVHCLREQPSLACSLSPPQLIVSYGWLLRPERLAFDPRELAVSIALDGAASASQARQRPALLLMRSEQPSRTIRLAGAEYYPNLRELFEPLAEMLGGPSSDRTVADVELPGGRKLKVSRTPRCDGAHCRKLRFIGKDRVRTSATWGLRSVYFALLGFGCLFVGGGVIPSLQAGQDWKHYLGAAVFASFGAAAAAIGTCGLLLETSTLIDRLRGCVEIGAAAPWRKPQSIRLEDVAAIQICSAPHEDSSPIYQLNWVLASPEGGRLPILDGHKPQLIERWARELGEFLDKPVLDHREESSMGPARCDAASFISNRARGCD